MKQIIGTKQQKRTPLELGDNSLEELANSLSEIKPRIDLETKVDPTNPIKKPSGNLKFITDIKQYNEIIKYLDKTFPNNKNILSDKLKFEDVMKGSNDYIAVAVDMYLKSINEEYRIATLLDLEQNLNFTKDTYNDTGLALRNLTNENKEQAIYLLNQLNKKGIEESDFPIWINLRGLTLDAQLNFNLTDESIYSTQNCLSWEYGTTFSKINNFGLPKEEDENSSRKIRTSNIALSGCYLDSESGLLGSDMSDLSYSDDDGGVVLAKPRSG